MEWTVNAVKGHTNSTGLIDPSPAQPLHPAAICIALAAMASILVTRTHVV